MKRLSCCLLLLGSIVSTVAQGYVYLNNSAATPVYTNNGYTSGQISGSAGSFYFALLAAPTSITTLPTDADPRSYGWSLVAMATNTATPGHLNGNGPNGAMVSSTYGMRSNFAVLGWSSNIGTTLDQAICWRNYPGYYPLGNGFFGIAQSIATNVYVAASNDPISSLFGASDGRIHGFTLNWYGCADPPYFVSMSGDQTLAAGSTLTLSGPAAYFMNCYPVGYQWYKGLGTTNPLPGATNSVYTVASAQTNDSGVYHVVASGFCSSNDSTSWFAPAVVTVYEPVGIGTQPVSRVVSAGASTCFSVGGSGWPGPYYQWCRNGSAIPRATNCTVTISPVGLPDLGDYCVVVSNAYSSTVSDVVTLQMLPSIIVPYTGLSVICGQAASLSVTAIGSGSLHYQWYKDGAALETRTNQSLALPAAQLGDAGLYSVVVSSALGSVTNAPAALVVNPVNTTIVLSGGFPAITVSGAVGCTYAVRYAATPSPTGFWFLGTNLTLQQPTHTWIDTQFNPAVISSRFYRVQAAD